MIGVLISIIMVVGKFQGGMSVSQGISPGSLPPLNKSLPIPISGHYPVNSNFGKKHVLQIPNFAIYM